MMEYKNNCLLFNGYTLVKESLDCVPMDNKYVIQTISPNSYGVSCHDKDMNEALKKADYLILDGVYFGWLPWFKYGKKAKRITGWDADVQEDCPAPRHAQAVRRQAGCSRPG